MLTVSQTAALLRTFDNILILTHVRPDGDTVGCAAALCAGLRSLGKTAFLLPNPELTDTTAPYFRPYEAPECFTPDKVVSTDIATVGLFPENARPYAERVDLAIDHHPSLSPLAERISSGREAAACGELIYDILSDLGPITPEMALPLYVAVSTDTGCFAYANTTAPRPTVVAALRCCGTGIDYRPSTRCSSAPRAAGGCSWRPPSSATVRFTTETGWRCCPCPLPDGADRRSETDAEDLSALGPQIEGVDCAITMRELRPDVWKMSLRTGPGLMPRKPAGCWAAATRCRRLHGGGPWAEARERILAAVAQVAPTISAERAASAALEEVFTPSGILIIDKPAGWTSMDVCAKVRGIFHEKRVGHGGNAGPHGHRGAAGL
ncbi:MAG: DHH family phosphoesterase [Oscillibacter sp.]